MAYIITTDLLRLKNGIRRVNTVVTIEQKPRMRCKSQYFRTTNNHFEATVSVSCESVYVALYGKIQINRFGGKYNGNN